MAPIAVAPDAFVVKLNPAGQIVYATYLGGAGADAGLGIAVDSAGSAYVVGSTSSQNFPVTAGAVQAHLAGSSDVFVAKLSPDGSSLVYATYLEAPGSTPPPRLPSIPRATCTWVARRRRFPNDYRRIPGPRRGSLCRKTESHGNSSGLLHIPGRYRQRGRHRGRHRFRRQRLRRGTTYSSTFPATPGAIRSAIGNGNSAAFLVKLNPTGTAAVYASILGGHGDSSAAAVAVDSAGMRTSRAAPARRIFPSPPRRFKNPRPATPTRSW